MLYPHLELFTSEVGRTAQTPGHLESFDLKYYHADQKHDASLYIPDDLKEQVGDGKLVIELEVDTREAEDWIEDVKYELGKRQLKEKYQLFIEEKTWQEAETFCQSLGGHLASILSRNENQVINGIASFSDVWLGGKKDGNEALWSWSDGSTWSFEKWARGFGGKGGDANCVRLTPYGWNYVSCDLKTQAKS